MTQLPFSPFKLPLAPDRYDREDQDRTRRMLELVLRQLQALSLVGGTGITVQNPTPGKVVISSQSAPAVGMPPLGGEGADGDDDRFAVPGPPGASITGPAGPQGLSIPGRDGEEGQEGPPGPPGATGATGSSGATGAQGAQGQSVPGMDGEEGQEGPPGPPGPAGAAGTSGSTGATGATGPQGPPGFDGVSEHEGHEILMGLPSSVALLSSLGLLPTANLGTGSATNAVFLRGDQAWATPGATSGGTGQTAWTKGDLLYSNNTNSVAKLAVGASTQVLGVASGIPSWVTVAGGVLPPWVAYAADTQPSSSHTEDDEFDSSSLNAKWTETKTGSPSIDYDTTMRSHYKFRGVANNNAVIVTQAFAPGAVDTSLTARIRWSGDTGGAAANIWFGDSSGTTLTEGIAARLINPTNSQTFVLVSRDGGVTTNRATVTLGAGFTSFVVHLQRVSNLWSAHFSNDGWNFFRVGTFSKTFTIANIHFQFVAGSTVDAADRMGLDWIRRDYQTL